MEIEVNGVKKTLKEISYLDGIEVEETREKEGLRPAMKKMLKFHGLTDEEAENLSIKEGLKVQQVIAKIGEDFRQPTESKQN